MTLPLNLPPTCTNAAYVLKRAYQQQLYNYEQIKVHGVPRESLAKKTFEANSDDEDNAKEGNG
jgi:hypothetical protein